MTGSQGIINSAVDTVRAVAGVADNALETVAILLMFTTSIGSLIAVGATPVGDRCRGAAMAGRASTHKDVCAGRIIDMTVETVGPAVDRVITT